MKKFIFGLSSIAIIITGIFTFTGCEKEEENAPPASIIKAHTILDTYYDATLIQQFMQTPLIAQLEDVIADFSITTNQGILAFSSAQEINQIYDTLIYFSNKWDSLLTTTTNYIKFDTSNAFPVNPVLYAFESITNFHSLRADIEEQLLQMEAMDGIGINDDPDTHYIVSPFMRALLTTDCEVIIGNYIYIYGDSLNIKVPDLNFQHLETAKYLINLYGEYEGTRMACEQHAAIQVQEENDENDEDEPEIYIGINSDGSYTFFVNSGNEVLACNWNFGDGMVSTDLMPTHAYAGNGRFPVTADVLFEGNIQPIHLSANVQKGSCNVTIGKFNAGSGLYIFTATATSSTGYPISYTWNIDGTTTESGIDNIQHQFTLNGRKLIIVKVLFSSGCIARDTLRITAYETGDCCRGNNTEKEKNISYCAGDKRLKHVFSVRNAFPFHRIVVKSVNYKKKNNGNYKREKATSLSVSFGGTAYEKHCIRPFNVSGNKTKSKEKELTMDKGIGFVFRVSHHSIMSFFSVQNSGCASLSDVPGLYLHDRHNCW